MNKKLQVFVSSTYTDLIEERQVAVEAILDAGHIPAGMELFKAGKSQMKTIQKWIDDSDVYMLILGGRYGSIEEESGLSYTELEYRYALSKSMPVFAIILDEDLLHIKAATQKENIIFEKDNIDKYNNFKSTVKSNIVKFVNSIDRIPYIISTHLNEILTDGNYHLVGWVRSDFTDIKSTNFKSLSIILNKTIVHIDRNRGIELNANELFVDNFYFFNQGIASSCFPNADILITNEILELTINPKNKEEILKITKLGFKYYNYLLLEEHLVPKKVTFNSDLM